MTSPYDSGDFSHSTIVLYQQEEGSIKIEVNLDGDTAWLTQQQIAELYQTTIPNINMHINNIYDEGELQKEGTLQDFLIVRAEGDREVQRSTKHYNLDMIIAIGFRVNSSRGTQFRKWANERLGEYIVKGFSLNDERLKGASGFVDYFDELLQRIRDIRASEARVYQMIRDIFALAVDYRDSESETSKFFAYMQNKMLFAATERTSAEIINRRADSEHPNMGLTAWKGEVVRKHDTEIAKNYLNEHEIDTLNRITVMFLDQAEFRAQRRQNIHMQDWEKYLDEFLVNNELPILDSKGSISRKEALGHAHEQYNAFNAKRQSRRAEESSKRYIEDLKDSAKALAKHKKK